MKHILILGGGFSGIAAAKTLTKKTHSHSVKITLIDKNSFHLFTPSLYEVATSEVPQKNIAIPLNEVFGKRINILQGKVKKINANEQTIAINQHGSQQDQTIPYDYLVIALGSIPAYYNISGLEENSIALKSIKEAVQVKNKIKNICCKGDECKKKAQVIIGGGGFSGTELAAELLTYKDKLAKQHNLSKNCLEITIIQGSERLLKELDSHVSKIAEKRIKRPNVHFAFGGHISKVTKTSVFTDDGKVYPYDLLIWTGGVEANNIPARNNLPVNKRNQLIVNKFLQVEGFQNIFAVGDVAQYKDEKTQTFAPTVAQVAEDEGKKAGENIARLIKNSSIKPYTLTHWGYVVPLRGKFAAAELIGFWHFDGFLGWVLEQLIFLRYLLGILPFAKALIRWNRFEISLEQ